VIPLTDMRERITTAEGRVREVAAKSPPVKLDPVRLDPTHHPVLIDNDSVRVIRTFSSLISRFRCTSILIM
jgi:hypothetical protein